MKALSTAPRFEEPRRSVTGYRLWTKAQKQQIVAEAMMPGTSVSVVSRRYDVNANLIFRWMAQFAEQKQGQELVPHDFIPIGVVEPQGSSVPPQQGVHIKELPPGMIIELGDGISVRVERNFDEDTLRRIIAAIKKRL
jgi:transposase